MGLGLEEEIEGRPGCLGQRTGPALRLGQQDGLDLLREVRTDSDLPVITATVLIAATFVIVANLVVDVLYAVIDPRVRLT